MSTFGENRKEFERQLIELEIRLPRNINEAYLYYKSIVRKSEGDFLSDFQSFQTRPDNDRDREIIGELEREKAGRDRVERDRQGERYEQGGRYDQGERDRARRDGEGQVDERPRGEPHKNVVVIKKGEVVTLDDVRYGEYMNGRLVRVGEDIYIGRVPTSGRVIKINQDQARRLDIGEIIQVSEHHFVYLNLYFLPIL